MISRFNPFQLIILTVSFTALLIYNPDLYSQNRTSSVADVEDHNISIRVATVNGAIDVDGNLSEAAWNNAYVYEEKFYQQEPNDRAPSTRKTRVMVLQDDRNIYFGMQAYEEDPSEIFATVMKRDGGFGTDDVMELLIDTFGDNRNSYAFAVTPLGSKIDAIISDEGNHINQSWDCVWYMDTAINDSGWAAEIAIPFKSLKYKRGEEVTWGLNITREIKHSNEITYLVPIPRGLGHNGKFKGALFADLTNIHPPNTGLNLEIQPYVRGAQTGYQGAENVSDSEFKGGLDVRYHITPQLSLDATYNTDFAQVESDQEIINLTRFDINLPEKREFFMESAGLFTFGTGSRAGGSLVGIQAGLDYLLFNSRAIGIRNGEKVPLLGGLKMTGRAGNYSIGAMNLQSRETRLESTQETVEPENYTAFRVKRDLFTNSNVGLMVLNKQSADGSYNRAIGSDVFYAFSPQFMMNGSFAGTFANNINSDNWAANAGLVVNTERLDFSLNHTSIDSLFRPEMGFIRRDNIRNTQGALSLTHWINNRSFKAVSLITSMEYITNHSNTLLTRENDLELWLTASSEDRVRFELDLEYEHLPEDDYIRDILIRKGNYRTSTQRVTLSTYRSRPISGSIGYSWGEFFDGYRKNISLSSDTKINDRFNIDLSYSYDDLSLDNGNLYANLVSARFNYAFSTSFFAKAFVQWNDADDRFSTYFLLDYIYMPRSHIYLVYNENRNSRVNTSSYVQDRIIQLKVTYLLGL